MMGDGSKPGVPPQAEFEMGGEVADVLSPGSLSAWMTGMLRCLFSSKTPFSGYVIKSIQDCRRGSLDAQSMALFPIPLPRDGAWMVDPQNFGVQRRYRLAVRRAVHLAVLALNYVYLSSPMSCLHLLRRKPSPLHCDVYDRIGAFVRAGGPTGEFHALGCGRKSFQLDARLRELLGSLQSLGLEASGALYSHAAGGADVPVHNDKEELVPYRSLDPSRLKITGTAAWECSQYLSDLLYMPFVEPMVNTFAVEPPESEIPNFAQLSQGLVMDLCKVWDCRGLVKIFPSSMGPKDHTGCTKVFNNYKSKIADRQIGDRRSVNFQEGVLPGPSRNLPPGTSLLQASVTRFSEVLRGAVTDRRDFYHQFATTDQRKLSNAVFPFFKIGDFVGMRAYEVFIEEFGGVARRKVKKREKVGDFLHGKPPPLLVGDDDPATACFAALFQGDHLGVEFATDAHSRLLEEAGLLRQPSRLLSTSAIYEDEIIDGLVIDDYFVISREGVGSSPSDSGAMRSLKIAKQVYQREGLVGSDDKDILGELKFKMAGAEVNSELPSVHRGLVAVGAPYDKRLGLALIAMVQSSLPYTSDAFLACLNGSLVSTMLFRRPAMAAMNGLFTVIPPEELSVDAPKLRPLSRAVACELQLLACLMPMLASNVALPFDKRIYATDASTMCGGIAEAEVSEEEIALLWRSADRKGCNLPLLSKNEEILTIHDVLYEPGTRQVAASAFLFEEDEKKERVPRPIGLRFGFLEICGGAGLVTGKLIAFGINCGPVIDLSFSPQYNLTFPRVVQWVIFMLEDGRLESFLVAPPCTSFSPAAFPCVRTYQCPRGMDQENEKVILGNKLAFAAMTLLFVALRLSLPGLGEQPRRSKMRWLEEWRRLILLGAQEVFLASCAYGSCHQKEFVFFGANMKVELLHRKCTKDHVHIPIAGKYTRPSAVYTPGLVEALGVFFRDHILARRRAVQRLEVEVGGLEDILSNDVCLSRRWSSRSSWRWKGASHINILETAATLKLYRQVAAEGGDMRFVYFGDSHVSRSCIARGRSSSNGLRRLLQQAAALCIAFGLYPAGRFCPTRFNPGDPPSREAPMPLPVGSISSGLCPGGLAALSKISGIKRFAANWIRLDLLLSPRIIQLISDGFPLRKHSALVLSNWEWRIDFDSTLGYPGEGPACRLPWIFLFPASWIALGVAGVRVSHGDELRKAARSGIQLQAGRRVTETTSYNREWLLENFKRWLAEKGWDFQQIVFASPTDVDLLNNLMTEYGRWLFAEGKPYYHYSETLNGVTSLRPAVRRMLQQSWDLAFIWGSHEPSTHHVAMPFQVLTAVLAVAISWGWSREAAVIALAWGALLRIGEIFSAVRRDLILPTDVGGTVDFVLLRILEPKTRYRAARHQCGKLEQPDLIEIIRLGLSHLLPHERLWPMSGATLRLRFQKILIKLSLPWRVSDRPKPMTLASLRPGGATWLITTTESAELVRRRGRWLSFKIMECYLQEVVSITYLNEVDKKAKEQVLSALEVFPTLLGAAIRFKASCIPEATWHFLFCKGVS